MPSLGTWWRTIRHLRGEQIVGRFRFRLARPTPDVRPAPPQRRPVAAWAEPACRASSFVAPDRFTFLNETHRLGEVGWDDPAIAKLWRYNLHYFDDLTASDAVDRRTDHAALIGRWIAENPPAQGTGWEPYPTSLRIINWIKWALAGAPLAPAMLDSLAVQARWLAQRLEWHLLGNHLFVNAKALLMAGLLLDGAEAAGWRTTALAILERELPEQILADGGQFERSPMYHALALEDVLDLVNALAAFGATGEREQRLHARLRSTAPAMLRWLRGMVFPDGGVTHFNDSADGIAPPLGEIERYAAALGVVAEGPAAGGTTYFPDSGFVRLAAGPAVAWLDVGPIGPDYLPGHAHADTLSFELALDGGALLVNGGTSCYGIGEQRLIERGTAMHNSVQLGNHDSSEVWSGFRVGRRARPFDVRVEPGHVEAAHDGYRFLPGRPVHRRRWTLSAGGLIVEDRVDPAFAAVARFRLAPGLRTEATGDGWLVWRGERRVATVEVEGASVEWQASEHAPEFGRAQRVELMCCTMSGGRCVTRWLWAA